MFDYNWFHYAPWGIELAVYFFLIGTAGMTFVLAAAPNVFGSVAAPFSDFTRPGLVVSLVLLAICGPLLILDLGQPQRFLYPIIYFHWTSPLSWGSLFLPLFGLCILVFGWGLHTGNQGMMKASGILGSLLALSMPLYTGLDLMVHQARTVWANPTLPVLFVILSITSGTALVSVVMQALGRATEGVVRLLRNILFASLGITFFLFLGLFVTLLYGGAEEQAALSFINAEKGFAFWGLTFVAGIVAPLVAVIPPQLARNPFAVSAAGVLGAIGAFMFRDVLLAAGQIPQLYY